MRDAFGVERGDVVAKGLPKGIGARIDPRWAKSSADRTSALWMSMRAEPHHVATNATRSYANSRTSAHIMGRFGGKDEDTIRMGRHFKRKSKEMLARAEKFTAKKKKKPLP